MRMELKSDLVEFSDGDISFLCTISNQYIKADNTIGSSGAYRTSDYIRIPNHAEQIKIGNSFYLGSTKYYLACPCVFYNSSKVKISAGTYHGYDYTTEDIPSEAAYVRFNQANFDHSQVNTICGGVWFLPYLDETVQENSNNITDLNSAIDSLESVNEKTLNSHTFTGTFSTTQQILNTNFAVEAGVTYILSANYTSNDYANSALNVFSNGSGGSANYIKLFADGRPVEFVCGVDGYLCLYNINGYLGDITLTIYSYFSRLNNKIETVYYVGPSECHTSLTALLLDLKDDKSNKTIIIRPGDYDIYNEYKALQSSGKMPTIPTSNYDPTTGYFPYNVFVPDNTHIIGQGIVRLNYMPTSSQTYENETKTLSPINTAGSCTIENVEIYCKNGRYCIHDDALQDPAYIGARKKYINVRAIKYVADDANFGTPHNFGCGVAQEMYFEFDNCYFETQSTFAGARTLYFHNRAVVGDVTLTETKSSNIVVKNSIMKSASQNLAVFFGNIGATGLNIRVDIDSCYIDGNIVSADESNYLTGNNENSFNIRTLLSKYNSIIVRDTNNSYTPVEFNFS